MTSSPKIPAIDPVKLDRLAEVAIKIGCSCSPDRISLSPHPLPQCRWCAVLRNMPTRLVLDW